MKTTHRLSDKQFQFLYWWLDYITELSHLDDGWDSDVDAVNDVLARDSYNTQEKELLNVIVGVFSFEYREYLHDLNDTRVVYINDDDYQGNLYSEIQYSDGTVKRIRR